MRIVFLYFLYIGLLFLSACSYEDKPSEDFSLSIEDKQEFVRYLTEKYNDMNVYIEIPDYDSLTYADLQNMDVILSDISSKNNESTK